MPSLFPIQTQKNHTKTTGLVKDCQIARPPASIQSRTFVPLYEHIFFATLASRKMISEFLSPTILWIGGCFLCCLIGLGLWTFWRSGEPKVYVSVVESLLTPAEQLFYRSLDVAIAGRLQILCKVRLADLFQVVSNDSKERHRLFRKIAAKHIDFLLVEPSRLEPILAIELDDSSHSRSDRRERDQFLDELFGTVEFPLLRVKAAASYSPRQILRAIEEIAGQLAWNSR